MITIMKIELLYAWFGARLQVAPGSYVLSTKFQLRFTRPRTLKYQVGF